jgi:hypothetical protein
LAGAAVALAGGMMLGDAMKPVLWAGGPMPASQLETQMGGQPQTTAAGGGGESGGYDVSGVAAYGAGPPPDYVVGTDSAPPADQDQAQAQADPRTPDEAQDASADAAPPPPPEPPQYETAADEKPAAPAVESARDGGLLAGRVAPSPPPADDRAHTPSI